MIIFFELSNIVVSFQRYINKIIIKKQNIFVIIYINNILFYIKNLGQPNMDKIYWVFEKL